MFGLGFVCVCVWGGAAWLLVFVCFFLKQGLPYKLRLTSNLCSSCLRLLSGGVQVCVSPCLSCVARVKNLYTPFHVFEVITRLNVVPRTIEKQLLYSAVERITARKTSLCMFKTDTLLKMYFRSEGSSVCTWRNWTEEQCLWIQGKPTFSLKGFGPQC